MDIEDGVRAYACAVVTDCAPERISAVSRFDAGDRHAVFRVSFVDFNGGSHDVVVRISLSNDAEERASAAREARVLATVHGVAAPVLHDFRSESPWFDASVMCMQFVPGEQRAFADAAPLDLEHLGAAIGSVHRLPVRDLVESFPDAGSAADYRHARVESILGTLPAARDPLPAAVQGRLQRAAGVVGESLERVRSVESFAVDDQLVLLHGDVSPENVIWDPMPVLIDWEYARLGDPADEIAYTFSQNGLGKAPRDVFWHGYRSTADDERRVDHVAERVGWWEPVTLLGSALWWVGRWVRRIEAGADHIDPSAPRAAEHYRDQALERLDRLEQLV